MEKGLSILSIICLKIMNTNNSDSFILTTFDEYRARLQESYIGIAIILFIDILFYLLKLYELSLAKNWFFLLTTFLVFVYFIVNTILYHKKQKEERRIVLQIDTNGIYLLTHGRIDWKQIKTVYLSGPKGNDMQRGPYLYIERKSGSLIGIYLYHYRCSFNLKHLKCNLLHFAAGRANIKVEVPFW